MSDFAPKPHDLTRKQLIDAIIRVIRDANSKFNREIEIELICIGFSPIHKNIVCEMRDRLLSHRTVVAGCHWLATDRRASASHVENRVKKGTLELDALALLNYATNDRLIESEI